jgi:hypothetical protein
LILRELIQKVAELGINKNRDDELGLHCAVSRGENPFKINDLGRVWISRKRGENQGKLWISVCIEPCSPP